MITEKLYKTQEVADICQVTIETVRVWLTSDPPVLKGIKTPTNRWRVPESSLKEFIKERHG